MIPLQEDQREESRKRFIRTIRVHAEAERNISSVAEGSDKRG